MLDFGHVLQFFLRFHEKKLQKYLVGVEKVRTFAPAKQGNAPFARGLDFVRASYEIFERLT